MSLFVLLFHSRLSYHIHMSKFHSVSFSFISSRHFLFISFLFSHFFLNFRLTIAIPESVSAIKFPKLKDFDFYTYIVPLFVFLPENVPHKAFVILVNRISGSSQLLTVSSFSRSNALSVCLPEISGLTLSLYKKCLPLFSYKK